MFEYEQLKKNQKKRDFNINVIAKFAQIRQHLKTIIYRPNGY